MITKDGRNLTTAMVKDQIIILLVICLISMSVAHFMPFVLPTNIFAMFLLFAALMTGVIKEAQVADVGDFLIANMMIMFVPVGVSLIDTYEVIAPHIVSFVLISIFTTLTTFIFSAVTIELILRLQGKRKNVDAQNAEVENADLKGVK